MKDFVGSLYVPKSNGYYITFTPIEKGVVEKYDSETEETTLIDTKKLKYTGR